MAIRTYGPLPVTIIGANSEGGPNYFFDCDLVAQRPDPSLGKDGDLAWTRDERKLYVQDQSAWVQLYPFTGAGGVGTSGRQDVTATNTEVTITHNQNNANIPFTVTTNWPAQSWEDEASRTANAVKIKFGVAAPTGAKLSWKAG